jgi:TonB-linked SusC/RagA family outer membrane protein
MRKLRFLTLLLLLSSVVMAQTRLISGTIKDSKTGSPLPSVTVKVKGKNISAITNSDGGFSLNVPTGSVTLEVSSVGYASTSVVAPTGAGAISIAMDVSTSDLGEVVVTALGISKEAKKLGYAVSTVNGEQLSKARTSNVALGLTGQVAGLNVHGTSGGPAGSARILLRGVSGLTGGGSPLFVVNGIPIDNGNRGSAGEWGGSDNGDGIGNINPDDIESMTVLKGLAASALYGSRAANGVILITTKTGKKNSFNIEYNANYVAEKAINSTDYQYVYGQGTGGVKPATVAAAQATGRFAWGGKMDGSTFTQFDGKTYAYSPYKNNIKDFYRWGPSFTNTVSVSGGSDKNTYRLAVSNLSNNAIVRNSGLDRKNVNFTVDQKVTDKLSVSVLANYIVQGDKNPPQLSDGPGNPNNGLFLAPNIMESSLAPGYDSKGREIVFSDDNYVTNPWFAVNKWVNQIDRKRLIGSVTGKYAFTSWLYAQGRVGYDNENDRGQGVTPTGTDYSYNSAGQSGSIGITTVQSSELNLDALLGVSHKITKDITFDATVGGNSRKNKSESVGISGGPFVIPGLYTPGNVLSFGRSYGYSERRVHSGFYSADFTYKSMLTLSTTGRYDAFSTLYNSGIPTDQRNIFTPSVSASFLFSELVHIQALSYGKLRASWAQTSGEPRNPYQTAVYYGVGNALNGVSTGNFSGTLPNLFLKPYQLREFEIGAELKFFGNRLGIDVAYFNRKSSKEIMNASLSWATGYNSSVIANGSIQNKGVEILITGAPIKGRDFNWNVSFNLTTISNKVLKTDAAGNNLGQGSYRPLNANTAYIVGLAGPQVIAHDYTYNAKGQIVVDGSGLPIADGALKPFGSVLPNLYGGLNNSFSYKNFDLSFLIDYNYGNKVLSATKYYALYRGLDKATLAGRESGIKFDGVLADGSANTVTATAQSYYQRLASISKGNVLSGDYIKLRQIALGYTISEKALSKVPIFSSIQISLVGRNLLTLMKHTDNIDPEAGFSSTIQYAGIEGTSLPSTRSFGINANFKFKK